jgi:hypothetical protein
MQPLPSNVGQPIGIDIFLQVFLCHLPPPVENGYP